MSRLIRTFIDGANMTTTVVSTFILYPYLLGIYILFPKDIRIDILVYILLGVPLAELVLLLMYVITGNYQEWLKRTFVYVSLENIEALIDKFQHYTDLEKKIELGESLYAIYESTIKKFLNSKNFMDTIDFGWNTVYSTGIFFLSVILFRSTGYESWGSTLYQSFLISLLVFTCKVYSDVRWFFLEDHEIEKVRQISGKLTEIIRQFEELDEYFKEAKDSILQGTMETENNREGGKKNEAST